jgi:hypothetical protein
MKLKKQFVWLNLKKNSNLTIFSCCFLICGMVLGITGGKLIHLFA